MSLIIDNEPRAYDWGTPGGISALRGSISRAYQTEPSADGVFPETSPDAPEAELWLGTHPSWQSVVASGNSAGQPLSVALREQGVTSDLKFLLKLLCVNKPLSLQVHPDEEQARAGFERENAHGVPLDAPERNYRDPYAKPEMLFVLSETFELCAGIRDVSEILDDVRRATQNIDDPDGLRVLRELEQTLEGESDAHVVLRWLLSADAANGRRVVQALLPRLRAGLPVFGIERDTLANTLDAAFPEDPGIVVSLLLRHERLLHGQAVFLEPGIPHFYIHGAGVELMGPSDNVLRAGLTSKHVDPDELLSVINPVPSAPRHLFEYHKGSMTVFHAATAGLRLAFTRATADKPSNVLFKNGDIAYVLDGRLNVAGTDGETQTATSGQALVFVNAEKAQFESASSGRGLVVVAGATEPA